MDEGSLLYLGPKALHRMAYIEWPGEQKPRPVICVHGLTRNGRDFDRLGAALAGKRRVLCPDIPGRGNSEWLGADEEYGYPLYVACVMNLLTRYGIEEVDWVGTSMGGLIGMALAALPGTPIRRMVLNDVGPLIAAEGLDRIGTYVGRDPSFSDVAALEAHLRDVAAPFGPLSDDDWRHLAAISARRKPDGSIGYAYDPRIGDAFRQGPAKDIDLWAQWEAIKVPTLILRGAESDLLRHEDALAMTVRGPRARLVELSGIGHAPALMAADQIALISDFLAL
jgi:pimeloyl-ACP methyl ester carboxylesterase